MSTYACSRGRSIALFAGRFQPLADSLVISHFQTVWLVARSGGLLTLHELAVDAGDFFRLPLPRIVREETKKYRNQQFVRFVERALKKENQPAAV